MKLPIIEYIKAWYRRTLPIVDLDNGGIRIEPMTRKAWEKSVLEDIKKIKQKEIVICSAVKATNGRIIRGHRHGDCFKAILARGLKPSSSPKAQGFITSKNRFVTREQGRILQDKAGIKSVDKEGYRGTTLFSEDLY